MVSIVLASCGKNTGFVSSYELGPHELGADQSSRGRRVPLPGGRSFYLDLPINLALNHSIEHIPLGNDQTERVVRRLPQNIDSGDLSGAFDNGARAGLLPRLIVGLKPGESMTTFRLEYLQNLGLKPIMGTLETDSRIKIFESATSLEVLDQLPLLSKEPWVNFVHPDFRLKLRSVSSSVSSKHKHNRKDVDKQDSVNSLVMERDPLAVKAWHLDAIKAPAFWTHTMGSPEVKVAVIDLGFEATHPDLIESWQRNSREIAANGIDDDGNGYVDDEIGWNFVTKSPNLIYGAGPGHGTATSGIIGARQNGIGSTGVCPRCLMMPLVIDEQLSTAIMAFQYAKNQGASVVSNSWGYALDLPVMQGLVDVIEEITASGRSGKGTSVVFAMGNVNRNDCEGRSQDISSLETVIAVSSVTQANKKAIPSGYGPCVDLVAPSSVIPEGGIVTTDRVGKKGFNTGQKEDLVDLSYTQRFFGTSAAAPQVAGALGLVYSRWPDISRQEAEGILFRSAIKVDPENGAYDPSTHRSAVYGYGLLQLN